MLTVDDEVLGLLPKRVTELVDVVGMVAALKLVEAYGGQHLWIPSKAHPKHFLAGLIGMEALGKLSAVYGDQTMDFDRCAALLRAVKDKTILDEFNGGMTNGQLAVKYGMTERGIRKIKRRIMSAKPPDNLDLFADFLKGG